MHPSVRLLSITCTNAAKQLPRYATDSIQYVYMNTMQCTHVLQGDSSRSVCVCLSVTMLAAT